MRAFKPSRFKGRPVSDTMWERLKKAAVKANVPGAEKPEQTDTEQQEQDNK